MSSGQILQANRPLTIKTPLGENALLISSFSGNEAISRLFNFQIEVFTQNNQTVDFDKLLGQEVTATVRSADDRKRHFSGIVCRVAEVEAPEHFGYSLEVVPKMWLLTRQRRSRIFQRKSVPDILREVLQSLNPEMNIQGTFHPRNYVVQYRETDFDFASRLMQDEGIYYYFTHSESGHKLVVANTPSGHPAIGGKGSVAYRPVENTAGDKDAITYWEKVQELRSGKYTLWDYHFEKPDSHLDAEAPVQSSVSAGTKNHKLDAGNASQLELYDYPGEYSQRFDGVDSGGGEQSSEIEKLFEDNKRTVDIRMQQEAVLGLRIDGAGECADFKAGHKFSLESHPHANGDYVLTSVSHHATAVGSFVSGSAGELEYQNTFVCIPFALPFRPQRETPKPVVRGTHTAVVVGPAGEEIFTDKYGRIKVQFHWDREGKKDEQSSCWIRVGTPWAGTQWGSIHIPRVGQEVIVDFLEGDPDKPICVGSVYNETHMPPYKLPDNKTQSGLKSRSTMNGSADNFNELRFEDKKDEEEIYLHAEKDFNCVIENNETRKVGFDKKDNGDQKIDIYNDQTVEVGLGSMSGSQKTTIQKDRTTTLKQGNDNLTIEMGNREMTLKLGNETKKISLGKSSTTAMQSIELKVGQSSIKVDQTGVEIQGMMVKLNGQIMTDIKGGAMTSVQASGVLKVAGGIMMLG